MNNNPLVSLIIISYNQKPYIDDCMKGLLHLSYTNLEVLYLDDCSPDGTFEAACQYETELKQKYNQVQFIGNTTNQGLIKNLNRLIEQSNGKYVKFMSADDFLLENSIAQMVEFMENHAEHDMIYSNAVYGDCNTHFPLQMSEQLSTLYAGEQPCGAGLFKRLYEDDFIAAPTVMIKREVYDRLGLYDSNLGIEDWDYFLRIAGQGSIGYLDQITIMYRFTNDSLSHSDHPVKRMNMQKSGLLIREKYKDLVENSGQLIEKSFNDAYQDALHIDNKEYFDFLKEYAMRNHVEITNKNRMRYLLYRLKVFKLLG